MATALASALVGSALAGGKPGYPDKVTWQGASWQVKTSNAPVGPGPCLFGKANVNVNVDANGFLHLRIAKGSTGTWSCAEVIGPTSYGYGTYAFTVVTPLDQFDPNVTLGLFTWSDKAPQAHREIDVEVARWGNPADPTNAQFVVQPYATTGHLVRWTASSAVRTRETFHWTPGRVEFSAVRLDTGATVASYTYAGSDVPTHGDERVHLNLWLLNGSAPTNGSGVDVTVESFQFTP